MTKMHYSYCRTILASFVSILTIICITLLMGILTVIISDYIYLCNQHCIDNISANDSVVVKYIENEQQYVVLLADNNSQYIGKFRVVSIGFHAVSCTYKYDLASINSTLYRVVPTAYFEMVNCLGTEIYMYKDNTIDTIVHDNLKIINASNSNATISEVLLNYVMCQYNTGR
jgi:hypothetical protein